MDDNVRVVCLVGSSRFKHLFHQVAEKLEKQGCLVLMMGFLQHADGWPVSPEEREVRRCVDRKRIDLADEVLVIDGPRPYCPRCWQHKDGHEWRTGDGMGVAVCPTVGCGAVLEQRVYIGPESRLEVVYAVSKNKPITYYSHRPELRGA
jgi:hypothetical protein